MSSIPQNSPFKLLQSYDKEDIRFFYGREKETRQLYDTLMRSKFVMVYGASGTGKTSLIQCGLQGMYSPRDWMPVLVRRKADFLDSIREELEQRYQERFADFREQQLEWSPEEPAPEPETFHDLRDLIRAVFNLSYVPVYLILDQFEEIFTVGDRAEQDAFFQAFRELDLFAEDLFCKIIIVTREEYIAHFYRYENRLPFLFENRFRVEKMRDEQLLSVVQKTLTADYPTYPTFEVEPGADRQILENLTDKRGEVDLTTLQVYLDRLYREDRSRLDREGREHLRFDRQLAGSHKIENVLADFLNDQVARVSDHLNRQYATGKGSIPDDLPLQVLFQLVTDQGTKQNKNAEEIHRALKLGRIDVPLATIVACLDEFAGPDSRILTQLRFAKTADRRYEIVHDRLAEQIFDKFSAAELRRREAITTIRNKRRRFEEAPTSEAKRQEYLSVGELALVNQSINVEALGEDMGELRQFIKDSQAELIRKEEEKEAQRQRELELTKERLAAEQEKVAVERRALKRQRIFSFIILGVALVAVAVGIWARQKQKEAIASEQKANNNLDNLYREQARQISTEVDSIWVRARDIRAAGYDYLHWELLKEARDSLLDKNKENPYLVDRFHDLSSYIEANNR